MLLALIRRSTPTIASPRASLSHRSDTRDARDARAASHRSPAADERYVGAFARVRLVRAWIGAAAAMVALSYAFSALLDRLLP